MEDDGKEQDAGKKGCKFSALYMKINRDMHFHSGSQFSSIGLATFSTKNRALAYDTCVILCKAAQAPRATQRRAFMTPQLNNRLFSPHPKSRLCRKNTTYPAT